MFSYSQEKTTYVLTLMSDLISSVKRVLVSKLRGPGFKSQPSIVCGQSI